MSEKDNDRVGYRRPPKHARFKPGVSGNPHGRPKGTQNMATVLLRELRQLVIINEGGKRKTVTKLTAAIKQLVNRAVTGDPKAWQSLCVLYRAADEQSVEAKPGATSLALVDQRVMQGILDRLNKNKEGK